MAPYEIKITWYRSHIVFQRLRKIQREKIEKKPENNWEIMKMILVLNLIGSLIHQSEAYKPVVVIHGLKEKVSDLDFLKDNITKVV